MKIKDVIRILNGKVICGDYTGEEEITGAFGADLMSDVLAFVKESTLILTGQVNAHVLHTAEMVDTHFVVFVRGKVPAEDVVELAKELGITLITTECTMYTASGLLFKEGLPGCTRD